MAGPDVWQVQMCGRSRCVAGPDVAGPDVWQVQMWQVQMCGRSRCVAGPDVAGPDVWQVQMCGRSRCVAGPDVWQVQMCGRSRCGRSRCVEGPDVWKVQAQPQVHGWHCTCQMPVSWQCWLCRASVHGASDGLLHCVEGDKLRRTKCDGVPRVDDVQFCRSLLPGHCCLGYAAWALLPGLCCLELCSSCDCQPSCCPRTPSDALETCAAHIV